MFIGELLLGLSIGSIIGTGARLFLRHGAVLNPRVNLGDDLLNKIDDEAYKRAFDVRFSNPDDFELRSYNERNNK